MYEIDSKLHVILCHSIHYVAVYERRQRTMQIGETECLHISDDKCREAYNAVANYVRDGGVPLSLSVAPSPAIIQCGVQCGHTSTSHISLFITWPHQSTVACHFRDGRTGTGNHQWAREIRAVLIANSTLCTQPTSIRPSGPIRL